MKKALLLFLILLCACSPSQGSVQTAIAQTESASGPDPAQADIATRQMALAQTSTAMYAPTATHTSTATVTATPTDTATPTATSTSTVTLTPTPDLRVVETDPQKLLCTINDLPEEGNYYLPNSEWAGINTNEEVISNRTVEKGRAYVIETGRVTGWWVTRKRGTRAARLPDEITCGVYTFKTSPGALLAMEKFNITQYQVPSGDWKIVDRELDIDQPYLVLIKQVRDSGGNTKTNLEIELTYQNLLITVEGYSPIADDVPLELLVELANKMLERIKEEPLVNQDEAIFAK